MLKVIKKTMDQANVLHFPRKPIELVLTESAQRIKADMKSGRYESKLEAKALLAIVEGDFNESQRLIEILEKRKTLGLKLI